MISSADQIFDQGQPEFEKYKTLSLAAGPTLIRVGVCFASCHIETATVNDAVPAIDFVQVRLIVAVPIEIHIRQGQTALRSYVDDRVGIGLVPGLIEP